MKQMKAQWKKRGRTLVLSLLLCLLALPMKAQAAEPDFEPERPVIEQVDLEGTALQGAKLSSLNFISNAGEGMTYKWKTPDERMITAASGESTPLFPAYMDKGNNELTEVSIPVNVLPIAKIEITKAPSKTTYLLGEDFNPSGIEVTAYYIDQVIATAASDAEDTYQYSRVLDSDEYTITNGTNLKEGQESVTVETAYGQSVTQPITVTTGYIVKINGLYSTHYDNTPGYDKENHILTLNEQAGAWVNIRLEQPEGATYQGVSIGKGITGEQLTLMDTAEHFASGKAGFFFTMPANDVELTINWSGLEEKKTENTDNTDKKEESANTGSDQSTGDSNSSDSKSSSSGSSSSSNSTPGVSEPQTPSAAPKTADTNAERVGLSILLMTVALLGLSGITRRSFWRRNNH